jgi:hypothetical protein
VSPDACRLRKTAYFIPLPSDKLFLIQKALTKEALVPIALSFDPDPVVLR